MTPGGDNQSDLRADMDILNADETPVETEEEDSEETGGEGEGSEEPTEEKSDEEPEKEDEGDKEEKEEPAEVMGHARPTVSQIKSKYPNFFKDFPDMKHMLFREGEYTQVFPTIDDAKDAASKSSDFDRFSNLLQSGKADDFGEFLKGIQEAGDDALTSMAANFLPALYKTNKDMYFGVTTPIAESLLRNAYKAALQTGNENLKNAAEHIALWAMGDSAYARGEKASSLLQSASEAAPKDERYEREKAQFYTQKYTEAQSYVTGNAAQRLEKEIRKGLDPGGVFNEFTSKLLSKQILEEVGRRLEADSRHMENINSLWRHAHKAGFAGNWKDRILTTYLSRARAIMPAIRTQIRNEALKGQESRDAKREHQAGRSGDRREVSGSQNSGQRRVSSNAPLAAKNIDWNKTSDLDLLNDKVTFKR